MCGEPWKVQVGMDPGLTGLRMVGLLSATMDERLRCLVTYLGRHCVQGDRVVFSKALPSSIAVYGRLEFRIASTGTLGEATGLCECAAK